MSSLIKSDVLNIVWLQAQTCSGDTIALLDAVDPSLVDMLLGQAIGLPKIELVFHPTLIAKWGIHHIPPKEIGKIAIEWNAVSVLDDAIEGKLDPYILVVEGSIPNEDMAKRYGGYFCSLGERYGEVIYSEDYLKKLAENAIAVVAVGTCASFGGIPAGRPNPTGARGVYDVLGHNWKSKAGIPVINVPGCPAAGDWQMWVFTHLLLALKGYAPLPELDEYHRPKYLYGETVHLTCPRGVYYAANLTCEKYGEEYCLFSLGCKGPITYCPINKYPFNKGICSCTPYGSPCIGCTMPEFPDEPYEGFLVQMPPTLIPPLELVHVRYVGVLPSELKKKEGREK